MRCSACQHDNRDDRHFCGQCGTSLAPRCGACGADVEQGDRFCGECGESLTAASQAASVPEHSGFVGERRQITVLFSDVVDSTEHARRLGLEGWRELVRSYHDICAEQSQRFEGNVAQYLGDGVLVYFGYPAAHESDAEGAVRTALGIGEAMAPLNADLAARGLPPLQVRVGIHTGPVVADTLGDLREPPAVGETIHLASRFEQLAEPDSVVISRTTQSLVREQFELEDLGTHHVKGFDEPVSAWRVVGERSTKVRFSPRATERLPALVGREEELALLAERWKRARGGDGQAVTVAGDAGIGKSRLIAEFSRTLSQQPHRWLAGSCSPFRSNSALSPLIELLREELGWQEAHTSEKREEKLESMLGGVSDTSRVLLGGLLGVEPPADHPTTELPPETRRQATLEALAEWLQAAAREAPVTMLIEDLHWADASTLEFLERAIRWSPSTPILLILTHRPDHQPKWGLPSNLTTLALPRLSTRQSARLVDQLLEELSLDPEQVMQVVEHADGVPLYIEELVRMIRETTADPGSSLLDGTIPVTLQDLLEARLDRLGEAKEVARFGAVIGRSFSYEMLSAVSQLDDDRLLRDLEVLLESDVLRSRGTPPRVGFAFCHWLVHSAAYAAVLPSERRELHARVAHALEHSDPETTARQPDLLAHHHREAGAHREAMVEWEKAAQLALAAYANEEGIAHAQAALEELRALEGNAERDRQEVRLLLLQAGAMIASHGFGHAPAEPVIERAVKMSRALEDPGMLEVSLAFMCGHYTQRGRYVETREIGEELVQLSNENPALGNALAGRFMLALGQMLTCAFEESVERADEAIAMYDPDDQRPIAPGATDIAVASRGVKAMSLWALGHPDRAVEEASMGVELARLRHPSPHYHTLGWTLTFAALISLHRREPAQVKAYAEEIVELSSQHGFNRLLAWGNSLLARVRVENGDFDHGARALEQSLAGYDDAEAGFWHSHCQGMLAVAYGGLGRFSEAFGLLERSQTQTASRGERFYEAELHRVEGDLVLSHDPTAFERAEACYQRALDLARESHGRSWELRALCSLTRLRIAEGRGDEERKTLRDLLDTFEEGSSAPDYLEGRAILAQNPGD